MEGPGEVEGARARRNTCRPRAPSHARPPKMRVVATVMVRTEFQLPCQAEQRGQKKGPRGVSLHIGPRVSHTALNTVWGQKKGPRGVSLVPEFPILL